MSETSLWKTIVVLQKTKLRLCVILVLLFPHYLYSSTCSQNAPRDGQCRSNNSSTSENRDVHSSSHGDCSFICDLCHYTQGCRDPQIGNWTVTGEKAFVKQESGCGNSFSVLESPWLNFTTESCVRFHYSRYSPHNLDVFLEFSNGSVELILNRTLQQNLQEGIVHLGERTVPKSVSKFKFRAFGGGGSGSLSLYNVSITSNRCEISDALVTSKISPSCSGKLTTAKSSSPMTRSGGDQRPSGNPFKDDTTDDGPGAAVVAGTVIVVVAVIAVIVVIVIIVWRRRRPKSSTGGHTEDKENEISTLKTDNVGGVATRKAEGNDGNDYTAIRKSHFALASPSPEEDYVEIDDVTSPTKIKSRDADVRAHDTAKIRTRDDADIKRYDVPKVTTRDADNTPYDPAKIRNRDDADIKHYDVPKVTTRDADNTPHDLAKITTHDDDIDPYDHVEDGAPGAGRNSGGHDHKRFQLHDAPHQKPFPSEKVVDGDYSEIDGPQDITRSDVSDSYSRVQKTNKKPGSPDPKDDYSVANKKGKKPEVAAKFEQPEGDYNRIRLAGSQPVASNTPRDAPSDPYNRIGKVSSRDDVGNGGESTKAEGDQVQDDYNTLSFDEARKMSAKTTERETTHKAYDRVQTDPYSKAQVGKRKVVIDSDYDHVEK